MPINGSENKSVSTNTTSSTGNINSIKINEITSTIGNSLNNIANSAIENYDLDEPELSKEGVLNRDDLDFSRIGSTAGNVKDGNFVNVKNPEYWGDTGDLTYKIRDDGTVAISEDGVILGFTDLQGIRIKEADTSFEEQIITEETSNVTSEKETEEVKKNIQNLEETEDTTAQTVEQKEEVQVEPVEEIKEESQDVSVETLDETPIEPAAEVQEDKVIEPQVEQPVEQQVDEVLEEKQEDTILENDISIKTEVEENIEDEAIPIEETASIETEIPKVNIEENNTSNENEVIRTEAVIAPTATNNEIVKGYHYTTGNTTYNISEEEFLKVAYVVQHETKHGENGKYEDALGVMSVILNRMEDGRYSYANSPIDVVSASGQFSVWSASGAASFTRQEINPEVLRAMNDALYNGIRNNDYVEFKSSGTSAKSITGEIKIQLVSDGNKYHNLAQHIDRCD